MAIFKNTEKGQLVSLVDVKQELEKSASESLSKMFESYETDQNSKIESLSAEFEYLNEKLNQNISTSVLFQIEQKNLNEETSGKILNFNKLLFKKMQEQKFRNLKLAAAITIVALIQVISLLLINWQ
jgi:hypothetical protein